MECCGPPEGLSDLPIVTNDLSENVNEASENGIMLKIPPSTDVPDAKPSAEASEVDAHPIRWKSLAN